MSNFRVRDLSALSYAQGFTFWHYRAGSSTLLDVLKPGFFDGLDHMAAGDMITVTAADGGAVLFVHRAGERLYTALMARTPDPSPRAQEL